MLPACLQVRRAYKSLVTKAHPDKGGDPARFKAIQKAYEVLGDQAKVRGQPACGHVCTCQLMPAGG
jgi:trans-2-enoyl-CoA reductase